MREAFAGRGKRGNEGQCVHIQDNGCRAERKHHRGGVGGTGEGGGEGGRGGERKPFPQNRKEMHMYHLHKGAHSQTQKQVPPGSGLRRSLCVESYHRTASVASEA